MHVPIVITRRGSVFVHRLMMLVMLMRRMRFCWRVRLMVVAECYHPSRSRSASHSPWIKDSVLSSRQELLRRNEAKRHDSEQSGKQGDLFRSARACTLTNSVSKLKHAHARRLAYVPAKRVSKAPTDRLPLIRRILSRFRRPMIAVSPTNI